ncbi:uncharacterized protein [Cebidichthys violaceus]|uniref:uncharacterized protein n=1 Tax=Cebidichthys violaceus TaxID=271503 RepID=UPI0035CC4582
MASSETPSLSLRHGVRVQPDPCVPVEAVLLAVGDRVGHVNLSYASRMNRGVVVFLKEERFVADLISSGVTLNGVYLQVSPLAVPSTRVTVSGVPPFISNQVLERELQRFGKLASSFKTVGLGCKDEKLKHVQSFRRQVFMFLTGPSQTLEVSFRVKHGEGHYMLYASTGSIRCFECGDVGHKRAACPRRPAEGRPEPGAVPAEELDHTRAPLNDEPAEVAAPRGGDDPPTEEEHSGQTNNQVGEQRADSGGEKIIDDNSAVLSLTTEGRKVAEEALTAGEDEGIRESGAGSSKGPTAEADQGQAAGPEQADGAEDSSSRTERPEPEDSVEEAASTRDEPSGSNSQVSGGEDMEHDSESLNITPLNITGGEMDRTGPQYLKSPLKSKPLRCSGQRLLMEV